VATDHPSSNAVSAYPSSAIENEIPTYRAISPRAVLSVICGFLALFSLAHPFFYLFAILAVVLGFTADRNIQLYPDILTGRTLAQMGVGMGLIFGLAIFTVSTVQAYLVTRNANGFASFYGTLYKSSGLGEILWWGMHPSQRKSMTAEDVIQKLQTSKKAETAAYDMRISGVRNLKKRLDSSKDQELHFVKIEREGAEGLTHVALALFEVHGPPSKDFPQEREYALGFLKGISRSSGKGYDWWVDELVYPYKPQTADLPETPIDDGHGHSH
jgi:hypothetical protein